MMHRVTVVSPDGTTEEFLVRIDHPAFDEWIRDRDGLRAAGFPDRPPDVVTETVRLWVPHAGEEALPFWQDHTVDDPGEERYGIVRYAWRTDDRLTFAEVAVIGNPDGSMDAHLHLVLSGMEMPEWNRHFEAIEDPTKVGAEVEGMAAMAAEMPVVTWERVLVTDYAEFSWVDQERQLAIADAARGFPSPLPEGRA